MPRSLPDRPSLEHLRGEAKALLKSQRQGRLDVCPVLRRLGRFTNVSDTEILSATVTLAEAQFALAMDYGFPSWRALKAHVDGRDPHRFLHVFWSREIAQAMRQEGLPGTVIMWGESLIDGPTPTGVTADEWYALRAPVIAGVLDGDVARAEQALRGMDAALAMYPVYREVVLWFDACLYDQIMLTRHLAWFAGRPGGDTIVSLVVVGSYPGIDPFHGLGQLSPAQLAGLLDLRQPVDDAQFALGAAAWAAYLSPDPTDIERVLAGDTSALPYLGPALRRHLERFPSVANGLCRLEQEALALIAVGTARFPALFDAVSRQDQPAYFSDEHLRGLLHGLAQGVRPLMAEEGDTYALTDAGRDVLTGQADRVALNGMDRWLGGAHLQGREGVWRWDGEQLLGG